MAKQARRKGQHTPPRPAPRPSAATRADPPEVVAVRTLGAELRTWQAGARGHGTVPTSLALAARIGPVLLDAHGLEASEAVTSALTDLVATLDGRERALAALGAVLAALPTLPGLRAREYLRGVVAAEAGESLKLQHGDALAGALASVMRHGDADTLRDVVQSRADECAALAADVYGTVLGAPLLAVAGGSALEQLAATLLDERAGPAFGIEDAVHVACRTTLRDEPGTADRLTARQATATVRWAEWCDAVTRRPLLPQTFTYERWQGEALRKLASELVDDLLTVALAEERYDDALRMLADPPAPVDERHDRLVRVLAAIPAPSASSLAVPRPSDRERIGAAVDTQLAEIEALHEPECKRLDRPGLPYDEWVFEQTALLMGVHAVCRGEWARAYDHADEFAWARHDRDVPIGVMYLLALAGGMELDGDTLVRPAADETLDDVTDTPAARLFGVAADLRAALEHGYEPDVDELVALLTRIGCEPDALDVGSAKDTSTWAAHCAQLREQLVRLRAEVDARAAAEAAARAVAGSTPVDSEPDTWDDTRTETELASIARGDPVRAGVLDVVADQLAQAGRADLDEQWLAAVEHDERVRHALGDDAADMERVRVLTRLDRTEAARAPATALFWRALNGSTGPAYSAPDLADLIDELGAPADELVPLRAALGREDAPVPDDGAAGTGSVLVLFVGGNEIQAQYHAEIERALPPRVTVQWFTTGWSARWGPEAERIEAAYARADAVVLMQFTRTQLGRRLRRSAGEAGLPWIPCTGHGRDSLRRAILRAVAVVDERGGEPARKTARA